MEMAIVIAVVVVALIGIAIKAVADAARSKEREKQARLDGDLAEESEDVANSPGPDAGKLSAYWNRMRKGK